MGHLLGAVIQQPLSQWSLVQVRNVILAMADLLSGLESALKVPSDISARLKSHVSIIDQRMKALANEAAMDQVYHTALPSNIIRSSQPVVTPENCPNYHSSSMVGTGSLSREGEIASASQADDGWMFEFSPDLQLQLQNDLTADLPFWFRPSNLSNQDNTSFDLPFSG